MTAGSAIRLHTDCATWSVYLFFITLVKTRCNAARRYVYLLPQLIPSALSSLSHCLYTKAKNYKKIYVLLRREISLKSHLSKNHFFKL